MSSWSGTFRGTLLCGQGEFKVSLLQCNTRLYWCTNIKPRNLKASN